MAATYVLYDKIGAPRAFVTPAPGADVAEIIKDVAQVTWEYAQSRPDLEFGTMVLEDTRHMDERI